MEEVDNVRQILADKQANDAPNDKEAKMDPPPPQRTTVPMWKVLKDIGDKGVNSKLFDTMDDVVRFDTMINVIKQDGKITNEQKTHIIGVLDKVFKNGMAENCERAKWYLSIYLALCELKGE